jgi:AhpC/TSA family
MMAPMRRAGRRFTLAALLAGLPIGLVGAAPPAPPASLLETLHLARPTSRLEAPAFDLPRLDGRSVRLGDLRNRVVLLYFWATW